MTANTPRTRALPPPTRVDPVSETLHATPITDPYRWLEGDNSNPDEQGRVTPEVARWTDAQNKYTRAILDNLPGRAALEARMTPLMEVGAVTAPAVCGNRYFYTRRDGNQNQPIVYWREGHDGAARVLVDPAALDPSGLTTIEWLSPSPDGALLAYGTYRAGDELTTLYLLHVDTRTLIDVAIPDKTQAPDWLPDSSGFVYQNLSDPQDPYSGQIMFHRLGTDRASDARIFRQFTREENAELATTWGPFGHLSHDGRWLLLGYWNDTTSNDLWLVDFQRFLHTGAIDKTVVTVGTAGRAQGTVIDGTLYLHTTKGAGRGRVVAARADHPDEARWRDVVAERANAVIDSVDFGHGVLAVTYLEHAANSVEVFGLAGGSLGVVAQPGIGSAGVSAELDRTEAFLTFTSFNYPTTIFRFNLLTPSAELALWERPDVPVDPSTVTVEQMWYPSKDGTSISMFLVRKAGTPSNRDTPTLLTGYGGFGINMMPEFNAPLFQWFEAGGLFAMPNLRGGGEYGDAWHEAGTLERKQNVFDDFIAAAEWLIARGETQPQRLAIVGGSNGGLLTAAVVTQRPELFRAAIVAVPLLDMLRYHLFLMARYWVPEYGSSEDADQFAFLLAYSPYHHIQTGSQYPAVFLTAGEHDTRVHASHARKMAARLQASTASDPMEQPVMVWVDREAGHGQGKPLNLRIRERVDQRIFVMWQLGMLDGI